MSVSENTTNDVRVALSEQLRNLQTSIETIHNSVEERVKAVESKEREMDMNRVRLQNFKKELEVRQEKLEFEEKSLKQRTEDVELREKQVKEWFESAEKAKTMEAFEKRVKAVEARVNEMNEVLVSEKKQGCEEEMELKKKEIHKLKENYLKEVELRENSLNQRIKEVGMKEHEINEKINAYEADMTEFRDFSEVMMVTGRRFETALEEVMKGEPEERRKAWEERRNQINQMDWRKELLKIRSKELASSAEAKTREPQPVACSEIQLSCMNMDTNGLRSYLIKQYYYVDIMRPKISDSLQFSPDPAKLALNVIQSFYDSVESETMHRQMYNTICITLSGVVMKLNISITLDLKDDAMKFSIRWRGFFEQGYCHYLDISAFLQFLASYNLVQSYDADVLLSLLGSLSIKNLGFFLEMAKHYVWILGLEMKISGFIQSLITGEEKLQAVAYICACKLEDAFPPVPLLKAHLEFIQKRVQEMLKNGSDTAQNDALTTELSALRALLGCISNFKPEPSFSPAHLELCIEQLQKDLDGKSNAESVLTVKKNLSDLEKKGVALPGLDQSDSEIGKKRSLNSMVSQYQGKCLKSRKKAGDASINTTSETDVESTGEEENEEGKKENEIAERSDDEKFESEEKKDISEADSEEDAPKEKAGSGKAKQETNKKTPSVESSGNAASKIVVTPKKARLVPKRTPRKLSDLIKAIDCIESKDSSLNVLSRNELIEEPKKDKFPASEKSATKENSGKNAAKGKEKSKEDTLKDEAK